MGHAPAQDVAPRGEELRLAVEGERDGSAEIAASFTAAEQTLRRKGEGSVRTRANLRGGLADVWWDAESADVATMMDWI